MADLIQIDTDEEMDKYAEAELISSNPPPVAAIKKKTLNYNPTTGRNDVLTLLSTGGYVKVGDEELPRTEKVQQYARELENIGVPFDMADYEAAGFSVEEVQAAGVMPVEQEKTGRTEPLREGEELRLRREGEAIAAPYDPTLRQNTTDTLREIFVAAGLDNFQARQIAEGLIGNPNATRDLGIGVADFTPAGLFFGAQEGYRTFERGINTGDPATIGMGALEAGLSLLEAVPLTAAGAKAAKAGIPTLRNALAEVGKRLNQPGDMPTTSAFGVGAIDEAKPSAAELRRQANIQRFGYDPNDPVAEVKAPTETEPGIIAFHGSGADFDEFKLEKIGTGEGAQAFGYGLYFTDKEDIAKFYRDSVGAGNEVTYKGKVIQDLDQDFADENNIAHMAGQQETPEDMQRVVADEVRRTRNNLSGIEQSIKDFQENPDVYPLKFHGMEISMETAEKQREFLQRRLDAALEVQDNISQIETKPAGTMYQVGLHVNPDELIDYDKTFDEQSAFVQEAILKVLDEVNLDDAMNMGIDVFGPPYNGNEEQALQATKKLMLDNFSTVSFLNDWSVLRGAENSGEELLEKHGVKGITYKAQRGVGARNVPETGADNYVIFDDKLISIMKKYGIVGPVAVSAMASQEQEEA